MAMTKKTTKTICIVDCSNGALTTAVKQALQKKLGVTIVVLGTLAAEDCNVGEGYPHEGKLTAVIGNLPSGYVFIDARVVIHAEILRICALRKWGLIMPSTIIGSDDSYVIDVRKV